jgi:hypothetical protein
MYLKKTEEPESFLTAKTKFITAATYGFFGKKKNRQGQDIFKTFPQEE